MPYKYSYDGRNTNKWKLYDSITLQEIEPKDGFNPNTLKLINQDIFNEETGEIIHSSVRSMPVLPGVIMCDKNKTYGKLKNGKYLYRCIPDDKRIPVFLVPYKIKYKGFSKKLQNKYVVFKFKEWKGKHPIGEIVKTIGDINLLENFYEYQLYCKSLYASIQNFTKRTRQILHITSSTDLIELIKKTYKVEDRTDHTIYTIDPKDSKDFDDAFGLIDMGSNTYKLSIYISNVSLWLDIMDLWNSFSERVSTIYLPDRKRPMLPTILSDDLCSLKENEYRFAFTMDMLIKDFEIVETSYCNTCIKVKKNIRYDTDELISCKTYQQTLYLIEHMNRKTKYVSDITDSHDVIAYLMILMNYSCAKTLYTNESGIYRSLTINMDSHYPDTMKKDVKKFFKMWNSSGGVYVLYNNKINRHDLLKLDSYIHITSPIRRLIDLLNMINIQKKLGLVSFINNAEEFYKGWTSISKMDYINKSMRAIRRMQTDCNLLTMYTKKPELMEKKYVGYVFNRITRNDKLYQYMAYIPGIKTVCCFTTRQECENYSEQLFKMYLFNDEVNLKKKIRLELL